MLTSNADAYRDQREDDEEPPITGHELPGGPSPYLRRCRLRGADVAVRYRRNHVGRTVSDGRRSPSPSRCRYCAGD